VKCRLFLPTKRRPGFFSGQSSQPVYSPSGPGAAGLCRRSEHESIWRFLGSERVPGRTGSTLIIFPPTMLREVAMMSYGIGFTELDAS